jgi:hypothetical protein
VTAPLSPATSPSASTGARSTASTNAARGIAEPAHVELRGDAHRLGKSIGKAELDRLRGVEPGLLRHQRGDVILGPAGFGGVAGDEAALDLVERLGHRAHVVGGAHCEPRRVVDHQEGVLRHHYLVAGHRDVGGGRGGMPSIQTLTGPT